MELELNSIFDREPGGRIKAFERILSCLSQHEYPMLPHLVARFTGLPELMVMTLLYVMEERNWVKVAIHGKHWSINREVFSNWQF